MKVNYLATEPGQAECIRIRGRVWKQGHPQDIPKEEFEILKAKGGFESVAPPPSPKPKLTPMKTESAIEGDLN